MIPVDACADPYADSTIKTDIKKIVACIDLTRLNSTDSEKDIVNLCRQASTPLGYAASVCVYPQFVSLAWKMLIHTPVNIAAVINFPEGKSSLKKVSAEIQQAMLDGASEVDVVMPFIVRSGKSVPDIAHLPGFIDCCRNLCRSHPEKVLLKIILETGELSVEQIETASKIALYHGADFLKTSTGKTALGASPQAAEIMLNAIKNAGRPAGFKASGNIAHLSQAKIYSRLVKKILGKSAFSPSRFRIGSSRLLEEIFLCALPKQN